ncbi:MAG: hypothetical protein ACHP85_07815 [Burkholderiales bacterium]|jgi:hypothetical protein
MTALRRRLEQQTTEELLALLKEHDDQQWRPEVFTLAARILEGRGVAPPPPPVKPVVEADSAPTIVEISRLRRFVASSDLSLPPVALLALYIGSSGFAGGPEPLPLPLLLILCWTAILWALTILDPQALRSRSARGVALAMVAAQAALILGPSWLWWIAPYLAVHDHVLSFGTGVGVALALIPLMRLPSSDERGQARSSRVVTLPRLGKCLRAAAIASVATPLLFFFWFVAAVIISVPFWPSDGLGPGALERLVARVATLGGLLVAMMLAIRAVGGLVFGEPRPDPVDRGAASGAVSGFMLGLFLNRSLVFHGRTPFLSVPILEMPEHTRNLLLVLGPGSALVGALVCGLGAAWRTEVAARLPLGRVAHGATNPNPRASQHTAG